MCSKRVSRERDEFTRADWFEIRIDVMCWVLRVKLSQHIARFGTLLETTGQRPIVEWSRHDSFWGAGPVDEFMTRGQNVLGRVLTELRDEFLADRLGARTVAAPTFPQPRLFGIDIEQITESEESPIITADDLRHIGFAGRLPKSSAPNPNLAAKSVPVSPLGSIARFP